MRRLWCLLCRRCASEPVRGMFSQGCGKGIFRILGFLKWYIVRQVVYYKMTPSIFLGIICIKA
ncbi:hypothetical protein PVAP13_6NG190606 [Panicum virgatum]|uniref:Uncharacterized protein n=1 Tax=Panicum virgatum TaxID=38727 RepID=A0A8T0QYL7_PANVG|nr:hypothetical protein PVAP13_6NG190606 [Panicum virgatum]